MADTGREPDVVDLLLQQHARIEDLFRQVLASSGRVRRDAFDALARLLVLHETVEEEVVHPTARSLDGRSSAVVDARLAEETAAKQLLQQLAESNMDSDEFDELLLGLREAVLTHARREERYEFGLLRQELSAEQLRAMGQTVAMVETSAPTGRHPTAEAAAGEVVTAPPLALAEQLRHTLRDA